MMRRHERWLHTQLPLWEQAGLVTSEAAGRLRALYPAEAQRRVNATLVFAVIGALLIGGGVIMLIAHNWTELPQRVRGGLSLVPLLAAQGVAAYALWRKAGSTAWREASAGFLTLCIGASIALVSQSYQIAGDTETFLRVWLLVALPVVYLMRSHASLAVWAALLLMWSTAAGHFGYPGPKALHLAFVAAILPTVYWMRGFVPMAACAVGVVTFGISTGGWEHVAVWPLLGVLVFAVVRAKEGNENASGPVRKTLAVACVAVPLVSWAPSGAIWRPVVFGLVYSAMVLWGREGDEEEAGVLRGPFATLGYLASSLLLLTLTYDEAWRKETGNVSIEAPILLLLAAGALLGAIKAVRWRDWGRVLAGSAFVWVALGWALNSDRGASFEVLALMNLAVAVVAMGVAVNGLRHGSLRDLNLGLLVFSLLVLLRFFDSSMDLVPRALAFIAVGAGFLVANRAFAQRIGRAD